MECSAEPAAGGPGLATTVSSLDGFGGIMSMGAAVQYAGQAAVAAALVTPAADYSGDEADPMYAEAPVNASPIVD